MEKLWEPTRNLFSSLILVFWFHNIDFFTFVLFSRIKTYTNILKTGKIEQNKRNERKTYKLNSKGRHGGNWWRDLILLISLKNAFF